MCESSVSIPISIHRSGDADYKEMVDTRSTDPLAPQYEDPSTLELQAPPPVVTYKKEEEAAAVQPAPAASVRGRGGMDG